MLYRNVGADVSKLYRFADDQTRVRKRHYTTFTVDLFFGKTI